VSEATYSLPVIDGLELPQPHRDLLRPGALMRGENGDLHRLPRFFYVVDSSAAAVNTLLTPNFGLWEFMEIDLFEALPLRRYPRYVPCAVTALATALEVVRAAVGAPVRVAANGGYRSPAHGASRGGSPHNWGAAANIFRIGNEYLDSEEKIERYSAIVLKTLVGCWTRPYGTGAGATDDHLHVDLGYMTVVPRDRSEAEPD
jgi:hypothetical protein